MMSVEVPSLWNSVCDKRWEEIPQKLIVRFSPVSLGCVLLFLVHIFIVHVLNMLSIFYIECW